MKLSGEIMVAAKREAVFDALRDANGSLRIGALETLSALGRSAEAQDYPA